MLRVRGTRIILDRQTSDVSVFGPVDVVTAQGGRLSAGEARWSNAAQQLVAQRVVMAQGDEELAAEQLTLDIATQVLDLSGGADVAFRLGGAKP